MLMHPERNQYGCNGHYTYTITDTYLWMHPRPPACGRSPSLRPPHSGFTYDTEQFLYHHAPRLSIACGWAASQRGRGGIRTAAPHHEAWGSGARLSQ